MKLLYILFFIACLAVAVVTGMGSVVNLSAGKYALQFLATVETGNLPQIVSGFGDNGCDCVPKGGYITYLQYQSGHEPNLAFLVAHPFNMRIEASQPVKDKNLYLLPWQHPESTDVDLTLDFDKSYQPLFLPIKMAWGLPVSKDELNAFIEHPEKDLRGLTLRLRPGLTPGLIPLTPLSADEKLLPPKIKARLRPSDAGPVISPNQSTVATYEIRAHLPRLKSLKLKLHVVRRGMFFPWTIKNFEICQPAFTSGKPLLTGQGNPAHSLP